MRGKTGREQQKTEFIFLPGLRRIIGQFRQGHHIRQMTAAFADYLRQILLAVAMPVNKLLQLCAPCRL